MEAWIDAVQWPAMALTVAAAWCVASRRDALRAWGFWLFLASNALWIAWGWSVAAWALVVLQVALAALNIRGALNHAPDDPEPARGLRGAATSPGSRPAAR
jgi:hypothetical protein